MEYIFSFLTAPFMRNLPFFIVMLILQSVTVVTYLATLNEPGFGMLDGTIAWTYLLTLPLGICNWRPWRIFYQTLIGGACLICAIIQLFILFTLHEVISVIHVQLVLWSNPAETKEFIQTYVWPFWFIFIPLIILVLGDIWYDTRILVNKTRLKRNFAIWALTLICIFLSWLAIHYRILPRYGCGIVLSSISNTKTYETYDLSKTERDFTIEEISPVHPVNIILVMGESFDKNHSSLYGYGLMTNPLLSQRVEKGEIAVFENVVSPATFTVPSLIMSLTLSDEYQQPHWETLPTLLTALKKAGYHTSWLSNQTGVTLYNNVAAEFAKLCDRHEYTNKEFSAYYLNDDRLFPLVGRYVDSLNDSIPSFCMIHLIGSHFNYSERYPQNFDRFTAKNYLSYPENQREVRSQYDNSILFNDFVVNEIINMVKDTNTILIYTADHGEDLFYTFDGYACHGMMEIPESKAAASNIPFLIYFSDSFRQHYPEMAGKISMFTHESFDTRYLINSILEIAGYTIKGFDVIPHSLFKGTLSDSSENTPLKR